MGLGLVSQNVSQYVSQYVSQNVSQNVSQYHIWAIHSSDHNF